MSVLSSTNTAFQLSSFVYRIKFWSTSLEGKVGGDIDDVVFID